MKITMIEGALYEKGLQEKLISEGVDFSVLLKGAFPNKKGIDNQGVVKGYRNEKNAANLLKSLNPDILFKTENTLNLSLPGKTIGPNSDIQKIEEDRIYGQKVIKDVYPKIKIPKTTTDLKEALKFKGKSVVVKTQSNKPIVSLDMKTVVTSKLNLPYIAEKQPADVQLIYQEFIEGVEVGVGGYYSGNAYIKPLTFIQEYKRLHPNTIHNNIFTGESGSCGIIASSSTIPHLTEIANAHKDRKEFEGYYGYLDVNTIITPKGDVYFLEYTPRMGFPTEYEVLSMLDQSYSSFLKGILEGKDFKVKAPYFASVVITDYYDGSLPYKIKVENTRLPIKVENVSCEVEKVRGGYIYTPTCSREQLMVVTAFSYDDVRSAEMDLYDYLNKGGVSGQGIYYLDGDVGANWYPSYRFN